MQNQIENQIRQSRLTISLLEIISNQPISEEAKKLIDLRMESCHLNIKILELEMNKPKFDDVLFNICNPALS
jgi:hypothetical protein